MIATLLRRVSARRVAVVIALVLLSQSLAIAQTLAARTSLIQLEGRRVGEFATADMDGDGRADLILSTEDDDQRSRRIEVWLHKGTEPVFSAVPDRTLDVVKDVVAWCIADIHPNPGREIVLLSPSLAVGVYQVAGDPQPKLVRIGPIELLWQPPHLPHTYLLENAVGDVNRDGFDDLLVPEFEGYRALVQERAADGATTFRAFPLTVPPPRPDLRDAGQARLRAQGDSLELRLREGDRRRLDVSLEVDDAVPAPFLRDWDGDGDLDVVALVERELCVWDYDNGFAPKPSRTFVLPEFELSLLNPSNSVQLVDLDLNGRLDVVFVTARVKGDEAQSFIDVFIQDASGALPSKATDRLMLQGFVDLPRFFDIDGDRREELIVGSLRPDVVGALSSGGSGKLQAQINVFVNRFENGAGRFARPVGMVEYVELPKDVTRGRVRRRLLANFFRDLDGDGLADFVQRTDDANVRLRPLRRDGSRFSLGDPLWQMVLARDAFVVPALDEASPVLFIVESRQVMRVELRREDK